MVAAHQQDADTGKAETEIHSPTHQTPHPTKSQLLWIAMLVEKRKELIEAKADRVLSIHSFHAMHSSLTDLSMRDRSTRVSKLLLKLNPVFERLKCLTNAISVFIQADPTYSSLVWGGILVCLECFTRNNKMFSKIVEMFDSVTKAMPRFEQYMELYPKSEGLEYALLNIYRHFTDACICAIRFFRRKPAYRPLCLVVSNVVQNFERATQAIEGSKVEFEREARLAHDIVAAKHRKTVENALGKVRISPKIPAELFSVPFAQNPMFSGQYDELHYILWKIQDATRSQKSCVIHGIGGIGKTQLALEFTYRFRTKFRYIFWLAAEDEATLSTTYSRIATLLSLTAPDQAPSNLTIEVTRRWLCENPGWLLVFDNADSDPSLMNQFWPPCRHGSIIITSQRTDLNLRASHSLKLQPFGPEAGSDLLLRHLPDTTDKAQLALAKELTKEVDGLPLLLVGLGGFLSQSYTTLDEVLRILRNSRISADHIFSDDATMSAAFQYERPIQLVFRLSLDRLPPAARDVINIMSMLSPEDIPESLFAGDLPKTLSDTLGSMDEITFAKEVRRNLGSRHLTQIRRTGSVVHYSIHRSVQRSVLNMLDDDHEKRQSTFDQAVSLIYRELPRPSPIMVPLLKGFDHFAVCIPHVISIHNTYVGSQPPMNPTLQFAEMICSALAYLYESGLAKLCLEVASTGEKVCQQLSEMAVTPSADSPAPPPPSVTPATATAAPTLSLTTVEANISAYGAGVLWTTGGITDRKQAHEMTWRVLQLREKHIRDTPDDELNVNDHVLLSNAYNDWALQLINEGKYAEARGYSEKSLAMKERLLVDPENHQFEFFISKIFLASAFLAERRHTEAKAMAREAIAHIEREKGAEDPYTLHYTFHVANVLPNCGEYREAVELHKVSVEARVALFGETNHDTLNGYFAVALCLYKIGENAEAKENVDRCLQRQEAAQWSTERILRAKYLQCLIMQRIEPTEDRWRAQELETIAGRNDLLSKFAEEGWAELVPDCRHELVSFDYLVNIHAGRTTIGLLDEV